MRFRSNRLQLLILWLFLSLAGTALANKAEECYQQGDKACLEALQKNVVEQRTAENLDAVYYLGELYLKEKQYEQAKKQFELGAAFGDGERSVSKFVELIKSGNVEIKAVDCMAIGSEECFLSVAQSDPESAGSAYYLLARTLSKSDAKRTAEYTLKAAESGHTTASCLLAFGYSHEKASGPSSTAGYVPELPKDYAKARKWSEACGNGPFKGYSENHFNKYLSADGHKAYAKYGSKYRTYEAGAATAEIAASLAGALCEQGIKKSNKKDDGAECLIVSVDGEWVDYFKAKPLPSPVGSTEDLLHQRARDSFVKYQRYPAPKVFAQGPLGNWIWKSENPSFSIAELKRLTVAACQKSWRYTDLGSACKIINVNGEWVE